LEELANFQPRHAAVHPGLGWCVDIEDDDAIEQLAKGQTAKKQVRHIERTASMNLATTQWKQGIQKTQGVA